MGYKKNRLRIIYSLNSNNFSFHKYTTTSIKAIRRDEHWEKQWVVPYRLNAQSKAYIFSGSDWHSFIRDIMSDDRIQKESIITLFNNLGIPWKGPKFVTI